MPNVHELPGVPKPALTHEEMWERLKAHIVPLLMKRRTPQAVFDIREVMGELERERTQPWRDYIHERQNTG